VMPSVGGQSSLVCLPNSAASYLLAPRPCSSYVSKIANCTMRTLAHERDTRCATDSEEVRTLPCTERWQRYESILSIVVAFHP